MVDKIKKLFSSLLWTVNLSLVLSFIFCLLGFLMSSSGNAEVIFEAYSRVNLSGAPVGYTIQKYEVDRKKAQFIVTTFLKTNDQAGNIQESLKALSNDKMQPLSYQYTFAAGDQTKLIDIKFKKNNYSGLLTEGSKKIRLSGKIKEGTFLSSMLMYVLLQKGIKANFTTGYYAFAEESGTEEYGDIQIASETDFKGSKAFKVINKFKNEPFESILNGRGEALQTVASKSGVSTEMMLNKDEAIRGFSFPQDTVKLLFGSIPEGTTHGLNKKLTTLQKDNPQSSAGKNNEPATPHPKQPDTKVPFRPAEKIPDSPAAEGK